MQTLTFTDQVVSAVLTPESEVPHLDMTYAPTDSRTISARDQKRSVARRRKRIRTQLIKRRRAAQSERE